MVVVTKSGGEGECNIRLNITDRADRIAHDAEVPLWMEENSYFQTEAVISPRGFLKSSLNNCNLLYNILFKSW